MAATNTGFVNINSDLGESFGPWVMGNDAEVLKIVRSANVACGFHASDPVVMMDTVKLCAANGVSIGAHPGFADLQGFGRRVINLSVKELEANIAYQIGALQAIAALHGAKVTHMKPHGMMANMSADNAEMSEAIARATKAVDRDLIFLCQANTEQGKAAQEVRPARRRGGLRRPHLHRCRHADAAQGSQLDDQGRRRWRWPMCGAWSTSRRSTRPRVSAFPARSIRSASTATDRPR